MTRLTRLILLYLTAFAIGAIPGVLAVGVLGQYAQWRTVSELNTASQMALRRAQVAVRTGVQALEDLHADGAVNCGVTSRRILAEYVERISWIDRVGIVDRDGTLLCSDHKRGEQTRGYLGPQIDSDPDVVLAIYEDEGLGTRSLVSTYRITQDIRLFTRIRQEFVAIDALSSNYRGIRSSGVFIGNEVWYSNGGDERLLSARRNPVNMEVADLQADSLPITSFAAVSEEDVTALYRGVRNTLIYISLALSGVLIFGATYLSRSIEPTFTEIARKAMKQGKIKPRLIPIIDYRSKKILGAEVVPEWKEGEQKFGDFDEWSFLATRSGIGHEISYHILQTALRQFGKLFHEHPEMKIGFSLLSADPRPHDFADFVKKLFDRSNVKISQALLYVNHARSITEVAPLIISIKYLQSKGMGVIIDNVANNPGALYSIQSLTPDRVAIDARLIRDVDPRTQGKSLVAAIVELAAGLGLGIIAKGVQNEDQAEFLGTIGIAALQGEIFGPPMSVKFFRQLVDTVGTVILEEQTKDDEDFESKLTPLDDDGGAKSENEPVDDSPEGLLKSVISQSLEEEDPEEPEEPDDENAQAA